MNIADLLYELADGKKARITSWEKGDWIALRGDGKCFLDVEGNEYGLEILSSADVEDWEVFDEARQERIDEIIDEINSLEVDAAHLDQNIDVLTMDLEYIRDQIEQLTQELEELE